MLYKFPVHPDHILWREGEAGKYSTLHQTYPEQMLIIVAVPGVDQTDKTWELTRRSQKLVPNSNVQDISDFRD